jgi:hypothetical protein
MIPIGRARATFASLFCNFTIVAAASFPVAGPTITISYCTEWINQIETTSIRISYHNSSNDTLVYWLQNWRFVAIMSQKEKLDGFPYTSSAINLLLLMPKSAKLVQQLSDIEYTSTSVGELNGVCMKKANPGDAFTVTILIRDKTVLRYVRDKKTETKLGLILSIARYAELHKRNNGLELGLLLKSNEMTIDYLPVSPANNVRTQDVDLGVIQGRAVLRKDVMGSFKTFLVWSDP